MNLWTNVVVPLFYVFAILLLITLILSVFFSLKDMTNKRIFKKQLTESLMKAFKEELNNKEINGKKEVKKNENINK